MSVKFSNSEIFRPSDFNAIPDGGGKNICKRAINSTPIAYKFKLVN